LIDLFRLAPVALVSEGAIITDFRLEIGLTEMFPNGQAFPNGLEP